MLALGFSTSVVLNPGRFCLQNLAWSGDVFLVVKAGERGVLPAPSAGKAGTLLKSPQAHSQPPHLRVTPLSYDNGGVVEKPGSAAREMNFFSILDPETHFLTRV